MKSGIKKHWLIIILLVLTFLGGILRFSNLNNNPPGLTVDEVSTGYNAYSILRTGRDEFGNFLPLSFKSLGDYKPPFYIYVSTIPIAIFGLNEFSTRFFSALMGTLTIPLAFFLFRKITNRQDMAIVGVGFFAISPWHIYYSRLAFESPVAMTLIMAALFCFLKLFEGAKRWFWGWLFFSILALFTYHSARIFVPIFFIYLIFIFQKNLHKKKLFRQALLGFGVILISVAITIFWGSALARAQMTTIINDPDFVRNFFSNPIIRSDILAGFLKITFGSQIILLFFYLLDKFISYFQPALLFFQGLQLTEGGSFGLGLMYFFEIPFLIAGAIYYFKKPNAVARKIILGWLILGVLPSNITMDKTNSIRLLLVAPALILISATGAVWCFELIQIFSKKIKRAVLVFFLIFATWNMFYAFLIFTVQFPAEKSEDFLYGSKQMALYALSQRDNYSEIVIDPMMGSEFPNIRSVPHLYLLFYSKYDPATYQNGIKTSGQDIFKLDKFTVRDINWRDDQNQKGVLFIGTPWEFVNTTLTDGQVKQQFYLLNGKKALMAVSP